MFLCTVFDHLILICVELVGSNVRVNISASEIRKLADQIVAESKGVHDALASVPVDKVLCVVGDSIRGFHFISEPLHN